MDKELLIELTNNLYRLTLLFPKKEPLRYKMRELADDILANSLRIIYPVSPAPSLEGAGSNGAGQYESTNKSDPPKKCNEERARYIEDVEEKLKVLDGFFEVAKAQNWVKKEELLNLQQEYIKLKEDLEKSTIQNVEVQNVEVRPPQIPQLIPGPGKEINQRQEKILAFLRENGRAQVWQAKQILPEVSKRTLRRDFEFLLKQGKIERIGERNETFYQLLG